MSAPREPGSTLARLVKMGRDRHFDGEDFEETLTSAAEGSSRGIVLRELLMEWAGISVDEPRALQLWASVTATLATLERALGGQAVSLQTALLHELHTRQGLVREPRLLSAAELAQHPTVPASALATSAPPSRRTWTRTAGSGTL